MVVNKLDRRALRTRALIFEAFDEVLKLKHYSKITVQDIIDEANIGRSTFYSHFSAKDELLNESCKDILSHVFSEELREERSHNFAGSNDFRSHITHILYHLRDNKNRIISMFAYENSGVFISNLKKELVPVFQSQVLNGIPRDISKEFLLNHMVSSFIEAVHWWIEKDMEPSPELISNNLMYALTNNLHKSP